MPDHLPHARRTTSRLDELYDQVTARRTQVERWSDASGQVFLEQLFAGARTDLAHWGIDLDHPPHRDAVLAAAAIISTAFDARGSRAAYVIVGALQNAAAAAHDLDRLRARGSR